MTEYSPKQKRREMVRGADDGPKTDRAQVVEFFGHIPGTSWEMK